MNFTRFLLASAVAGVLPIQILADFTVVDPFDPSRPQGPVSPYYLDDSRNIYVIQGNAVINSFPLVYGDEGVMAVSTTVNTRGEFTPVGGTGTGGQYTLSGMPTGVTETYPLPAALYSEVSYDGTSSGSQNFYVEHFGQNGPFETYDVYATDLNWQNPTFLFSLPPSPVSGKYEGIAYDSKNNSLWISGGNFILDYSLSGNLLAGFVEFIPPDLYANAALGYDAADNTLWISYGGTNLLEQYSTSGDLLQYGTPNGLPNTRYYASGDFAVPEPSALVLLATAIGALVWRRRR